MQLKQRIGIEQESAGPINMQSLVKNWFHHSCKVWNITAVFVGTHPWRCLRILPLSGH